MGSAVIASNSDVEVYLDKDAQIAALRQKDENTERALEMLYRVLKPWPAAREAMIKIFPEAAP